MNCPDCNHPVIRKTKDIDSKFMGWVECSEDNCNYEDSFANFKAASGNS